MTSALVRQELGRPRLEAIAYGYAIMDASHPDSQLTLVEQLLAELDPVRLSPALLQLLAQIRDVGLEDVSCTTKAQRELTDRAAALTLYELRGVGAWSVKTLIALLNQLPPVRRIPSPAWHRDLAAGLDAADADDGAGDVAGLLPAET